MIMTREEELRDFIQKTITVKDERTIMIIQESAVLGLTWADEHPKQKEEHQRGLCGNMIN